MSERRQRMSEEDLKKHVTSAIQAAISFDNDDLSVDREQAIEYYFGQMDDVPAESDRSKVVSKDVADTIGWILPSLMRVFAASDRIGEYEGRSPEHVQAAREATDLINYLFLGDCDGYAKLYSVFHDALLVRNGIVKHWWDRSEQVDVIEYASMPEQAIRALMQQPNHEIIEGPEPVEPEMRTVQHPETGEPMQMPEPRWSLKCKKTSMKGKLRIEAVPLEEFIIERAAYGFDDARLVGHRMRKTRGQLVDEGYDREKVDNIPILGVADYQEEKTARRENRYYADWDRGAELMDTASEYVEVIEAYVQVDFDGDGVAEWMKVVIGGLVGESEMLDFEEWDGDLPFTPIIPDPVPHRWLGRSTAEEAMDIQRIKTVLLRQLLDNAYFHNHPIATIFENAFVEQRDIDAISDLKGPIHVNRPVGDAIAWFQVPSVINEALQALGYADEILERRTGVSKAALGLDPDTLRHQTATAVSTSQNASYGKVELYARNIAETGLKRLFRCLYKLVRENYTGPATVRRSQAFTPVDPSAWPDEMDVAINVGLGAGSREKDVQALSMLGTFMQTVISMFGPDNPVASLEQVREIGVKMAEAHGIKNYEPLIGAAEAIEQWKQQQAEQAQQQPPDPEMMKAQAKIQADQMKAQADMQADQQKLQAETQASMQKMQMEAQIRQQELQQQMELQREKMQQELQIKREQIQAEIDLKGQQIRQELALRREMGLQQAANAAAMGNGVGVNVGGRPG